MFVFGEVQTREQAPWAYDATNDLPKAHPAYAVAAGLSKTLFAVINPLGAGAFSDTANVADAFYIVQAGKSGYITDFFMSAQSGHVQAEIMIDGTGQCLTLVTPDGGGCAQYTFQTPIKVNAGQKISFQLFNIDATNSALTVKARANLIEL